MYVYIYIYICMYVYVNIYIYIYIEQYNYACALGGMPNPRPSSLSLGPWVFLGLGPVGARLRIADATETNRASVIHDKPRISRAGLWMHVADWCQVICAPLAYIAALRRTRRGQHALPRRTRGPNMSVVASVRKSYSPWPLKSCTSWNCDSFEAFADQDYRTPESENQSLACYVPLDIRVNY